MKWRRWLGACCASALSCSAQGSAPPGPHSARLAPGIAALVGSEEVTLASVSRVAAAQGVSPAAARDRLVSDALFALAARSAYVASSLPSVAERSALARALLQSLKADAIAAGPGSDAEVAELTAKRWQELDRPETVRTTHAIVRVKPGVSDADADALALRVRQAVSGITDPEQFMRVAEAVPHEGFELRAERLPAITADGRAYYPENAPPDSADEHFDRVFAEAANALAVGQISQPIKTSFGYHVILCEARFPEQRMPLEQRRARLQEQVVKRRADHAKQELLKRLNGATPTLVDRAADDLTARAQVSE